MEEGTKEDKPTTMTKTELVMLHRSQLQIARNAMARLRQVAY